MSALGRMLPVRWVKSGSWERTAIGGLCRSASPHAKNAKLLPVNKQLSMQRTDAMRRRLPRRGSGDRDVTQSAPVICAIEPVGSAARPGLFVEVID
jgi:hypothetical protein